MTDEDNDFGYGISFVGDVLPACLLGAAVAFALWALLTYLPVVMR